MNPPSHPAAEAPAEPRLEFRPVAELRSLGRGLEFLAPQTRLPAELVRQGLVPPLPVCGVELLWGFPLLDQAEALGLTRLPCRALAGLNRAERLALALRLEGRPGGFSWAQKRAMHDYLAAPAAAGHPPGAGGTDPEADPILAALSPLIEGHPEPQLPERLRAYAALPPELRQEVDLGRVDLKTALRASGLPPAVRPLVAEARLSFSQRRELLHGLVELIGRDHLSGEAAVALTRDILAASRPLQELESSRRPTVSALRRDFQRICQAALSGSGVRLLPPPWFEGEAFRVEFSFCTCRSLQRRLQGLARLAERCDELRGLLV